MRSRQQSFTKVGADGEVSGVFPGGVEIGVNPDSLSPPPTRRIRWVRDSDGALVADIFVVEDPVTQARSVNVDAYGLAGKKSVASLTAEQSNGVSASLNAFTDAAADVRRVGGVVGSTSLTILEQTDNSFNFQSSFVQTIGLAKVDYEMQWDAGAGLMRFYVNGVNVKSV